MFLNTLLTQQDWHKPFWKMVYFQANQVCYSTAHSSVDQVLVVKEGELLVQVQNGTDEIISTAILNEGNIVNVESLIESQSLYNIEKLLPYQVVALKDTEIIQIDKEFLLSHLYLDPHNYHRTLEKIITQLMATSFATQIADSPPGIKVAWTLFQIAGKVGKALENESVVLLPNYVTPQLIAQMAQVEEAKVSAVLQTFHLTGLFTQLKPLILDFHQLQAYLKENLPFETDGAAKPFSIF
ncbi:cyclic nucleotide-binding domain-containing protein [Listeria kieliensis]